MRPPLTTATSYINELLWVQNKQGAVVPLHLNRTQRAIQRAKARARKAGRPFRFLIPKARRMGVTTLEQALSFALCAMLPNRAAVTLAHTKDATQKIFEMVSTFYEHLPKEVRPPRKRVNRNALVFETPPSEFSIGTAGASGFGRGSTLQRVHGSEVAFWLANRDQSEVENLMAGLTEAASHGEMVLESTANGDTGWWYETVMEAWNGGSNDGNEWTVIFLPWWMDPTYRDPVTTEQSREIMATLSDREKWLVKDKKLDEGQIAWRRRRNSERALRRLFLQEYPERLEESFLSSESCYFDRDLLDMIQDSIVEPRQEADGVGIWEDPVPGKRYAIGADVAEGVPEGDYSAAYVLEMETGTPVARIHRKCSPQDFAKQLDKVARHYNGAILGPERNNHGHAVIQELYTHCGYFNLYMERNPPIHGVSGGKKRTQIKRGWSTDALSRPIMLNSLRSAIESGLQVRCGKLLAEAKVFENDGKGKFEARSGSHDDCVMAMAIALQIREHAPLPAKIEFL